MAHQKNHPVVDKYSLRTYYNKFNNQRCAISKESINKNVQIVNVTPLMTILNALNIISTKVFKYAKISLLPMLATQEETALIRSAAERLVSMTDPEWPEDGIGCSVSSYYPCVNWTTNTDYHELGTQHVAKALRQHVGTQIDEDGDEAKAILAVADRRWNETRPKTEREPDTISNEGFIVRNHRVHGEMLIDVPTKHGATVAINPWENEGHGVVKDAIKALGAKWDGTKKVWTIALTPLAVAMKDLDSLAVTKDTPVVVTPRAIDALQGAEWERRTNKPVDKIQDKVIEMNGQKMTVRSTKQSLLRRAGEVLIDVNGSGLKILFDFPKTEKLIWLKNEIKSLNARWNKDTKIWTMGTNAVAENLVRLFEDHKLVVTPEAIAVMENVFDRRSLSTAMDLDDEKLKDAINAVVPEGRKLFPFQTAGVAFLEKSGGRGLVGDQPGTGKTMQTATFLAYRKDLRPAIVIVPAVVATNWVNELEGWTTDENIFRIKTGKDEVPKGTSIVVVTYDLAKKHVENLKAFNPRCVVADESHYLKEIKTIRTQKFLEIAKHSSVQSVICLSGTPIVNRPKEFYTTLTLLRPNDFNSWFKFTERYCGGHRTKWGYQCNGATNTEELASRLKDVMIRRLKKDVLQELPAKLEGRLVVDVATKDLRAYKKALKEADTTLTAITAGRHALGVAKIKPAVEVAKDFHLQERPLLIFAHHKDVLDGVCEGLSKANISYGRIDGSVNNDRRGELVQQFQNSKLDMMVLSVKAAGVGITLTKASDVLFVERSWDPGTEEQASDRCHRIGQTDSVTVRYMMVPDTLDEDMDELLKQKKKVLESILDQGALVLEDTIDIRKELATRLEEKEKM